MLVLTEYEPFIIQVGRLMYFLPECLSIVVTEELPVLRPLSSPWPDVHLKLLVFDETLHFYDESTPALQFLPPLHSCENAHEAQLPTQLSVDITISHCIMIWCPPDFLDVTSACFK